MHRSITTVGPDVMTPDLEDVLRAMEQAPRGDDWPAVQELVIPVFPRVRPQAPGAPKALRILLPPGIYVGIGVDIGPAFMNMTADQLVILGVSEADLVSRALLNLQRRAEQVLPSSVVRERIDGTPVVALQTGLSVASTLVLIPDEIGRIFGREPRLFVAPMRDVVLGFPTDISPEIPASLYEEIAYQDPNCLAPVAFRYDGERITTAALPANPPAIRRLLA